MSNIFSLSFNKDTTHLISGTSSGHSVYSVQKSLEKLADSSTNGGIGIAKMLNKTNILLLIGGGDTPCYDKCEVIIFDQDKSKVLMNYRMASFVLNSHIMKKIIVVCLEKTVFVYNFKGDKIAQLSTRENERGILEINGDDENPIIATLSSNNNEGEILIYKTQQMESITISAHYNKISSIALNYSGKMIASSSICGTLIKIFDTKSGELLYELRRGSTVSEIYSLAFTNDDKFIACCSSNGTIHIFQLTNDINNENKNNVSYLNPISSFLPAYFSSQWSFKQIKIDTQEKFICKFDESNVLHVVSYDGQYFRIQSRDNDYKNISESKI